MPFSVFVIFSILNITHYLTFKNYLSAVQQQLFINVHYVHVVVAVLAKSHYVLIQSIMISSSVCLLAYLKKTHIQNLMKFAIRVNCGRSLVLL